MLGFWFHATERFFYIASFMRIFNISDVVHLECDTMVYMDFEQAASIFIKYYDGIAVTFDSDERVVPGLVFIHSYHALDSYTNYVTQLQGEQQDDTQSLASFKNSALGHLMQHLPVLPPSYAAEYSLISTLCASGAK